MPLAASNINDFLAANNFRTNQEADRKREADINRSSLTGRKLPTQNNNLNPSQTRPPSSATTQNENAAAEAEKVENANQENIRQSAGDFERRGKKLKNDALKSEAQAEVLEVSKTYVDIAARSLIQTGEATLEVLIGFILIPAGYMLKIFKFFFDRQVSNLTEDSRKKNIQGDKLLAQAAQLRGERTPLKKAISAVVSPIKNYFREIISDLCPPGFSPDILIMSMEERQKEFKKLIAIIPLVFLSLMAGIALLVIIIASIAKVACETNFTVAIYCQIAKLSGIPLINLVTQ